MMVKSLQSAVLGCLVSGAAWSASAEWVDFSEEGSHIVADVDGIREFKAVSSVVYRQGEKSHRIGTRGYTRVGEIRRSIGTTPFGEAEISRATYAANNSPHEFTLILKRLKNLQAFTLQGIFHNRSDQDVQLSAFDLLDLQQGPGGSFSVENPQDWLVTPLMRDMRAEPLSSMNNNIHEAGLFVHQGGQGFLMGPVGPAEAHTSIDVRNQAVKAWVQMDNVLVRAGESRRSEEMIFSFEAPATSIDVWTRWVAVTHGVRRNKGPVYGWCSWYDRTTKIDAAHVLDVTKTIKENPNTFGKGIIQIDDGYQKMDGDWSANEKFPDGMASVARAIRDAGCIPGVWFAPLMINPDHPWAKQHPDAIQTNAKGIASFMNSNPFHPAGANWINPDHPESKKFLFNIIKDARDRGYGYIKIDFNGIGSRFVDPTKTRLQVFRDLYALYREAAGEEMYILSCLGSPTRGVIGYIDAARVGPDSHPGGFAHCLDSVLRFQIFDNVWWQNDPDVSYLGEKLASRTLGAVKDGDRMWKTWHAITALVGGTAMTSEPLNKPDAQEAWRSFEIMRPASREPARLLTLGHSPDNTTFGFAADRPFGQFAVYNLYNVSEGTKTLSLDFRAAGLPNGVRCAVFDFWANRVVGYTQDAYTTGPLEQYASALLRFTPLDADGPVLVGSNLHLSMGATEVKNLRVSPKQVVIELTDAGAREGSLTFYSHKPLQAVGSEHCELVSVENLGEHLWRVSLAGRQWGQSQSVTLGIQ